MEATIVYWGYIGVILGLSWVLVLVALHTGFLPNIKSRTVTHSMRGFATKFQPCVLLLGHFQLSTLQSSFCIPSLESSCLGLMMCWRFMGEVRKPTNVLGWACTNTWRPMGLSNYL